MNYQYNIIKTYLSLRSLKITLRYIYKCISYWSHWMYVLTNLIDSFVTCTNCLTSFHVTLILLKIFNWPSPCFLWFASSFSGAFYIPRSFSLGQHYSFFWGPHHPNCLYSMYCSIGSLFNPCLSYYFWSYPS